MSDHIGRSFDGRPLEDACPCPQEPCGLIDVSRIDPACGQHSLAAGKTIRQSHTAERCPMNATTSPKPPTGPDLGLRTALTKLAELYASYGGNGVANDIHALLAAHPARPTLDHEYLNPINGEGSEAGCVMRVGAWAQCGEPRSAHPAPVLPAPPVVDEALALEEAADDMEAVIALGDAAESTAVPAGTTGVGSAIGARDALYEDPVAWLRDRAARLRGATR